MIADVWAVVPVFNEAATIGRLVAELRKLCPVIVVDDASTDGSAARAADAGAVCVIGHAIRRGKGAALRTGFAEALRRGAVSVATLDGDGQHDPGDLPSLLAAARSTPTALIVGDRLGPADGDRIPASRRAAIRVADWFLTRLTRTSLRDSQCGFRVYPAPLLHAVALREDGFAFESEALVRAAVHGHPLVSVPVRRVYPAGRRSRFRPLADCVGIGRYIGGELGRRLARWAPRVRRGEAVSETHVVPEPAVGEL